ncbi:unnamed protein product [Blepharisma stoltei]|uniref:ABC transporter domain-containing protein n=1 Tax=Blepharisma stoltei TaxID=1481888 RepID=A0AAU9JZD4_9CILI|nr:unnamed protein product [Blepharisma stoltei]
MEVKSPSLFSKTLILTYKNFKILLGSKISASFYLISPVLLCIMMLYQQTIATNYVNSEEIINPKIYNVNKIPKCTEPDCSTLAFGFTHGTTNWTNYTINHISKTSNFAIGSDIISYPNLNQTEFVDILNKQERRSQIGVLFCTNTIKIGENEVPCGTPNTNSTSLIYAIIYNFTGANPFFMLYNINEYNIQQEIIATKLALDQGLLSFASYDHSNENSEIELSIQPFPSTAHRFLQKYNVVASVGSLYLLLPGVFIMSLIVQEVVKEKSQYLKIYLHLYGASSISYWLSWSSIGVILSLISGNLFVIFGKICGFDEFTKTPYMLLAIVIASLNIDMMLMGCWASTMIKTRNMAYSAIFAFLLVGFCLQVIVSSPILIMYLNLNDSAAWVTCIKYALYMYPPFHMAMIFVRITKTAGSHWDKELLTWVEGTSYTWDDLYKQFQGQYKDLHFTLTSPWFSLVFLWGLFLFYSILTLYFDSIIKHNKPKTQHPLFFLNFLKCCTKNNTKERLRKSLLYDSDKLRIINLSKTYHSYWSKNHIKAVDNFCLDLNKDEIVGIIGQNGAGKSTLLSMLIGCLVPTSGTAALGDLDLLENGLGFIGYCPQQNILWDNLSGEEHIYIFSWLRGVEYSHNILKSVNLEESKDVTANCYSGGMKRRLSLAISSLGSPKIILMDEPTTGLDPINKRQVWKIICNLKQGRIVAMTTHSMEEAENLSDRVVVMSKGKLKAEGTPMLLKSTYSTEYTFHVTSSHQDTLTQIIRQKFPSVKIKTSSMKIIVSIYEGSPEVKNMVKFIENSELVTSWSISQDSLDKILSMLSHESLENNFELKEKIN